MNIYRERAHLLALIARDHLACIYTPSDAEPGFENAIAILIDTTWCSWHLSDDDMDLFDEVKRNREFVWDGQTTEEKYDVIRRNLKDYS